jgi:hypothetical protein
MGDHPCSQVWSAAVLPVHIPLTCCSIASAYTPHLLQYCQCIYPSHAAVLPVHIPLTCCSIASAYTPHMLQYCQCIYPSPAAVLPVHTPLTCCSIASAYTPHMLQYCQCIYPSHAPRIASCLKPTVTILGSGWWLNPGSICLHATVHLQQKCILAVAPPRSHLLRE